MFYLNTRWMIRVTASVGYSPESAPQNLGAPAPRRRGRKSLRNRTMDLTAHRNADWEDSKLTSDWDPPPWVLGKGIFPNFSPSFRFRNYEL